MWTILHAWATKTPTAPFLVESREEDGVLSYRDAYHLAHTLVPARLLSLIPALSSPPYPTPSANIGAPQQESQHRVILLTPNTSLLPLAFWSLWALRAITIPLSATAEPHLWAAAIALLDPTAVIVAPRLRPALERALRENALANPNANEAKGNGSGDGEREGKWEILDFEDIIPYEFLESAGNSGGNGLGNGSAEGRTSDYIPSLHAWLRAASFKHLPLPPPPPSTTRSTLALTLFTSSAIDASTLKCVTYTHAMLDASGARLVRTLSLSGREEMGREEYEYTAEPKRHLGWLPLSHAFELLITLLGTVLRSGGSYIFFQPTLSSPEAAASTPLHELLAEALSYHGGVTAFCAVPGVFAETREKANAKKEVLLKNLKNLHSLGVGGAPTPPHLYEWARREGLRFFDCSGITECVGTVCTRLVRWEGRKSGGLRLVEGLHGVLELEREWEGGEGDVVGELIVRATHLPQSYTHPRTHPAFSYDPATQVTTYRTGDLYMLRGPVGRDVVEMYTYVKDGERQETGFDEMKAALCGLTYIGRTDDTVVLNTGLKLDALAVERGIDALEGVVRSAVVAAKDGEGVLVLLHPTSRMTTIMDAVLTLNTSLKLPYDKRLRRENVWVVEKLPATTKMTLNRKLVKKWKKMDAKVAKTVKPKTTSHSPQSQSPIPPTIESKINTILARIFDLSPSALQTFDPLARIPLTSIASVHLATAVQDTFGVKVTSAQLFGVRSKTELGTLVLGMLDEGKGGGEVRKSSPGESESATRASEKERVGEEDRDDEELVITGASCRFPGGISSLETFWDALLSPSSYLSTAYSTASSRFPSSSPHNTSPNSSSMKMGFLDASAYNTTHSLGTFFGLKPRDVEAMSPNARLGMMLGYEALEDAGLKARDVEGRNWGVYSSVNACGWREGRVRDMDVEDYGEQLEGSADDAIPSRLSYFLNLSGPALEIKSACSSSLVSLHHGANAVRSGDCEAAIVVSSTTHMHKSIEVFRRKMGITQGGVGGRGKCTPFAEGADGFVPSEGAVAIILEKWGNERAVYATIRASAVGQDGRGHGFFAPNPHAQVALLGKALERGGCVPGDVDYIEAHGTGTRIGDAIEIAAISDVYGKTRRNTPLIVGAVKGVIGHTEECAGLAGVLKAMLCLKHNTIPPQPALVNLNPEIDFDKARIVVPRSVRVFLPKDTRRVVGVSSFGLSGTLAHVLLQDPPAVSCPDEPSDSALSCNSELRGPYILPISSRTTPDLLALLSRWLTFVHSPSSREQELADVVATAQMRREHWTARKAVVGSSWGDLERELRGVVGEMQQGGGGGGGGGGGLRAERRRLGRNVRVGMWFSLPGPGEVPRVTHPVYQAHLARIHSLLQSPSPTAPTTTTKNATFKHFAHQLALARTIRDLVSGSSSSSSSFSPNGSGKNESDVVTVVGGEGAAELLAGVWAGVLSEEGVFASFLDVDADVDSYSDSDDSDDDDDGFSDDDDDGDDAEFDDDEDDEEEEEEGRERLYAIRCSKDALEEALVEYRADEARVVGVHSDLELPPPRDPSPTTIVHDNSNSILHSNAPPQHAHNHASNADEDDDLDEISLLSGPTGLFTLIATTAAASSLEESLGVRVTRLPCVPRVYTEEECALLMKVDPDSSTQLKNSKKKSKAGRKSKAKSQPTARKPKTIDIISSHLGDVLDTALARSTSYWRRVRERRVDAPKAWRRMVDGCDVVVDLGGGVGVGSIGSGGSEMVRALGSEACISAATSSGLEGVLARLYELGADVDWAALSGYSSASRCASESWSGCHSADLAAHSSLHSPSGSGLGSGSHSVLGPTKTQDKKIGMARIPVYAWAPDSGV
ncbi:hypothetical protein BD410DRAFT_770959 [Rickenella mellea]|uniref:Ketosynthase family 3 (KS3) domain-containing protein n=1 Tax=Rickenella mellea TaxID=50990 RepID=A0A4Y7Q2U1_9AGAM|nr:hypothetical protein BD410DRAFT_770959 [Rickenella mellea]